MTFSTTRALALAAALVPGAAMAATPQRDSGWWVIVGSFPTEPAARMIHDLRRTEAAAARCGLRTFNDFSGKFRGFDPGYNVFVIGAYPSRAEAERIRATAKKCIPEAYVRWGQYAGE